MHGESEGKCGTKIHVATESMHRATLQIYEPRVLHYRFITTRVCAHSTQKFGLQVNVECRMYKSQEVVE